MTKIMRTNWTLMAKVLAREASMEEIQELERWSHQNKKNKQLIDMLEKNWETMEPGEGNIRVDTDQAWMNLRNRLENDGLLSDPAMTPTRKIPIPRMMRMAAAIILLMGLTITSYLVLRPDTGSVRLAASTRDNQEFGISLPDGSVVDLNAHSKFEYRQSASGERFVKLNGEAWFNVSNNPDLPFVVEAGNGLIRVTGTSFCVRTHPDGDRIEVYVATGSVQFQNARREQDVLSLEPGTMGVLDQNQLEEAESIDNNYLSWKTRKLTFQGTRLGDVAGVLNRTYGINIRFDNEKLEDCPFTTTFDQQPVDYVVKTIQTAFNLDMEQDKNTFIFSGSGCN
jgi:ferric-dicitrate binding protein FerR (iron transport regulator)